MTYIATDIGGTFTDLVAYDSLTNTIYQGKSYTDPAAITDGIVRCLEKSGVPIVTAAEFIHGSTIAINTAIERKGARTALFVTRGTRDVYQIGRGNRPESYNLFFKRPVPFVPRHLTFEISERIFASGETHTELDPDDVLRALEQARAYGVESVAVCFLHSYVNPEHERRVGEIINQHAPDLFVSLSHELMREYREYERTSTTVINAYVGPRMSAYLEALEVVLAERAFDGRVLIMQSNGGVMTPDTARSQPARTMESGPVGGAIAAARLASRLGIEQAVAFDMGGTTAKAALVRHGFPEMSDSYFVGDTMSGHPVMLPVVDVIEIGAGGGSIAYLDEVGALNIGPESAGGHPGPICYGWGGLRPTVTDANAVLGRLGSSNFLGGEMPLDVEGASKALVEQIGAHLGLNAEATARAIVDIAVNKMALAVRAVSIDRGLDPRDCALIAFGGAGPLHACAIARDLHIPTVVIPPLPGHFSALGMLIADIRHDFVRTCYRGLDELDLVEIVAIVEEMRREARGLLEAENVALESIAYETYLDLRYVGQEFTLRTPVSEADLYQGDKASIRKSFDEMHLERFGHFAPDESVEVINVRVVGLSRRPTQTIGSSPATGDGPKRHSRDVGFTEGGKVVKRNCDVWQRESLPAGFEIVGPAIIEEYASTTVLALGDRAVVGDEGELVVSIDR
ncbi:MAG TPA: hydantoinase/oxoprolinase family protein [Acidimicrobiales bacterium]|nr:hydantoinase/oxoprolinase family protein [Acidimicrobiales bacterium]